MNAERVSLVLSRHAAPRRGGSRVCGVATMKTRPTHPSCRDSVGLLAPRYMDGFGQVALLLVCAGAACAILLPAPIPLAHPCALSPRSPRYQAEMAIYFTGLALRQ